MVVFDGVVVFAGVRVLPGVRTSSSTEAAASRTSIQKIKLIHFTDFDEVNKHTSSNEIFYAYF